MPGGDDHALNVSSDPGGDHVVNGWLATGAAGLGVLPVALDEVEQHTQRHEGDLPPVQVQVSVRQVAQARQVLFPGSGRAGGQAFGDATWRRVPASRAAVMASR